MVVFASFDVQRLTYLSPITFFSLFYNIPYSCLLHSSLKHPEYGRVSIAGLYPDFVVKAKDNEVLYIENPCEGPSQFFYKTNTLEFLKEILKEKRFAIGYFSYDLCRLIEDKINLESKEDAFVYDYVLCFYSVFLIFEHFERKLELISLRKNDEVIKKIFSLLNNGKKINYLNQNLNLINIKSNFTKENYIKAILKIIDYIKAGDVYQVNLSQRFEIESENEPFCVFSRLCQENPTYFGGYLNLKDYVIICNSPERFLQRRKNIIQTKPIKGTRKKTGDKKTDEILKRELLESEKEKAELLMITDLLRNDLGKICKVSRVWVKNLREIQELPTVFHTLSTIEGELEDGVDFIDILKATFPGGSITGCPKIRSIQIIDEVERLRRGIYTGSLGWIDPQGDFDLNIIIRSFLYKDGKYYLGVGGGIVVDSEPEAEYYETITKAKGMLRVFGLDMDKWEDFKK